MLPLLLCLCLALRSAAGQAPPRCSLNGASTGPATCACDPGWAGAECRSLALLPAPPLTPAAQTHINASDNSWGISVLPDDSGTLFHGFMTELENGCALSTYSESSRIVHLTAPSLAGPWTREGVALPALAHNPQAVRDVDGAWLLFHIGASFPAGCSIACAPGKPPVVANASCYAHVSKGISVARATSPYGPWQRLPYFIPGNPANVTNPSALVLKNGTILLTARRWTGGAPFWSAPAWDGPYAFLGWAPVVPVPAPAAGAAAAVAPADASFDEDSFLYTDARGGYHMLTHRQPLGTNCPPAGADASDCRCGGGHMFAEAPMGPWFLDLQLVFNCTLEVQGSAAPVKLHARQRPTLTFHAGGSRCFTLFTGASVDPVSQYYSSITIRQEVSC